MKKKKYLKGLFLVAALFFVLSLVPSPVQAASTSFTYNAKCPPWGGGPCTAAATVWYIYGTNKNIYTPGEDITVTLGVSSDDNPYTPLDPFASLAVNGVAGTGDLVSASLNRADLTGGTAFTLTHVRLKAPLVAGPFFITVSSGAGLYYLNPVPKNIVGLSVVVPTGTVNVTSNIPGASWTITGPATIPGSGVSASYANQPTGAYTITWNDVAGYTKPVSPDQTLLSGGAITFSGTYTAVAPYTLCGLVFSPSTGCDAPSPIGNTYASLAQCQSALTSTLGAQSNNCTPPLSCNAGAVCAVAPPTINVHF